jgi:ATPase subunit of ABC transporter with duplicated ATPase domains
LPDIDKIKLGFHGSTLHKGKTLFTAIDINYQYNNISLWKPDLNFQINSGERIVIRGFNGTGKTTLMRLLLGQLTPSTGALHRASFGWVYVDQDYSLLNNDCTVYEQAILFNASALLEHEVKIRLSRFLFTNDDWDKPCAALSGGEKMRLTLCCLTLSNQSPDIIFLDEPTNNLDIQNIEILTAAIKNYNGTLIVVTHDERFQKEIKIERSIQL